MDAVGDADVVLQVAEYLEVEVLNDGYEEVEHDHEEHQDEDDEPGYLPAYEYIREGYSDGRHT